MENISKDPASWEYWVEKLDLQPHPEGGYFRETYRASESVEKTALPDRFTGGRNFSTAIYFLLTAGNFSAFHRIASDEIWHFYQGNGITVFIIHPNGEYQELKLGGAPEKGEVFQAVVPAGCWFASRPSSKNGWALTGCTVAPGFDFSDFEMAERKALIADFPQHRKIITELTRI